MIAAGTPPLRTLAFGDLTSGRWGVVWGAEAPLAAVCAGDGALAARILPEAFDLSQLSAAGLTLAVEGLHAATLSAHDPAGEDDEDGEDLLSTRICRLEGTAPGPGGSPPLDCLGLEVEHPAPDLAELDSLRVVLAWFAPDDALAVVAARPRKSAGHDRDETLATMFADGQPLAIDEARLSTTYAASGPVTRMSLELWTADEAGDISWRAAGEASGPPTVLTGGGITVTVLPMRCHRAGRDGHGVYLLARTA